MTNIISFVFTAHINEKKILNTEINTGSNKSTNIVLNETI